MLCAIVGPMFSSKTTTLIDALSVRSTREAPAVAVLTEVDHRSDGWLRGHDGRCWGPALILPQDPDWGLVTARLPHGGFLAVDEAQFFAPSAASALRSIADGEIDVYVAGLLRDFEGRPWETVEAILPLADDIDVLAARCNCGQEATETGRKFACEQRIAVGGSDQYEPLCRSCWLRGRR